MTAMFSDPVAVGVWPTQDHIDSMTNVLGTEPDRRSQMTAALRALGIAIDELAIAHDGCTTADCLSCWHLRYAHATFCALGLKATSFSTSYLNGGKR